MSKKEIYLDYAAATPMDSKVLAAMKPYFSDKFYNPSAAYLGARTVSRDLELARSEIAGLLGARPNEVVFTAGATEANNLAIAGVMRQFPEGEVLISSIEHESVLAPAESFKSRKIPVTRQGIIDSAALQKMISPRTILISAMMVNNELGTIQPLKAVAGVIHEVRARRLEAGNELPLLLHTDAAQAPNYLDVHVSRLGVDMLSLNGGKVYGPKQSGILFIRSGTKLQPLVAGGGQESGLRSGSENVAACIGLAKALTDAQARRQTESRRLSALRSLFIQEISSRAKDALINGSPRHQAPHIISVSFPGYDNERLMMELDEQGIVCAVGSACAASSLKPSHVLAAIGLSDELARSSLRFSLGKYTTSKQVLNAAEALGRMLTNR